MTLIKLVLRCSIVAYVSATFAACDGNDDDDTKTEVSTFTDEGHVCLVSEAADAAPGDLLADEPLAVRVVFDRCASSCARIDEATCEATVDGGVIDVTTRARLSEKIERGKICADSCLVVETTCAIGRLGAGTYRLELRAEQRLVDIPGSDSCD